MKSLHVVSNKIFTQVTAVIEKQIAPAFHLIFFRPSPGVVRPQNAIKRSEAVNPASAELSGTGSPGPLQGPRRLRGIFSILTLSVICYLPFAGYLHAEAPNLLTYQGRLVESGMPVDGIRKIEIKLCEGPAGTCYTSDWQNIAVSQGLFRSTFSVPVGVDLSKVMKNWHIGIWVEDSPLLPREKLTSSPYALYSATATYANNLSAAPGSPGITVSTSLFVMNGNVGIGTMGPLAKLHVQDGVILAAGTVGGVPVTGAGTRFMWIPSLGAIRAGEVIGTQWNASNIGVHSVAFGYNVRASSAHATVGGGESNTASGLNATVGGGWSNTASNDYATVGGGSINKANGDSGTVGGGVFNEASNLYATVGGGWNNTASGTRSTVGGGYGNTASNESATVGGGMFNMASGQYATVPGGLYNIAKGDYSFAAGRKSSATANGSFALSDSQDVEFQVATADVFGAMFQGGYWLMGGNVGISTAFPQAKLHVVGNLRVSIGSILSDFGVKAATITLSGLSGDPANVTGMIYYNTGNNKLMLYNGSAWVALATGTISGNFVSKDGDTMTGPLTVSGSSITIIGNVADAFSLAVTTAADRSVYHLFVSTMGNVGIGTTDPSVELEVNGDVKATAFFYASDRSLKKNIKQIENALGKIKKLKGISFKWKKSNKSSMGFIAQDLEKVLPELVGEDKSGLKSIQYGNTVALLVEGIKEQQEQIMLLQKEIQQLKERK